MLLSGNALKAVIIIIIIIYFMAINNISYYPADVDRYIF